MEDLNWTSQPEKLHGEVAKTCRCVNKSDKFATLLARRSETSHFLWRTGVLGDCCVDFKDGLILSGQYYFSDMCLYMPRAGTDHLLNSIKRLKALTWWTLDGPFQVVGYLFIYLCIEEMSTGFHLTWNTVRLRLIWTTVFFFSFSRQTQSLLTRIAVHWMQTLWGDNEQRVNFF